MGHAYFWASLILDAVFGDTVTLLYYAFLSSYVLKVRASKVCSSHHQQHCSLILNPRSRSLNSWQTTCNKLATWPVSFCHFLNFGQFVVCTMLLFSLIYFKKKPLILWKSQSLKPHIILSHAHTNTHTIHIRYAQIYTQRNHAASGPWFNQYCLSKNPTCLHNIQF